VAGDPDALFRQGMWWDPRHEGSGWDISRIGNFLFAIWYTYDADGEPIWYTSGAEITEGRFEGDLLVHRWNVSAGTVASPEQVGSLAINFPQAQRAAVTWTLDGQEGTRDLQPFRFAAEPTLEDYSGTWYDPEEPGYGITVQTQGEATFTVVYAYDAAGNPTWRTGLGTDGERRFDLIRSTGRCPSCTGGDVSQAPAGAISLEFDSETDLLVALESLDQSWDRAAATHVMISDPPSGRPHPAAMANLASSEALRFFFKEAWYTGQPAYGPSICPRPPIVSPAPPIPGDDGGGLVSQTNVQEAGVDEADLMKVRGDTLFSIDYPLGYDLPVLEAPEGETPGRRQVISQFNVDPASGNPTRERSFDLEIPPFRRYGNHVVEQGLYHHEDETGRGTLIFQGSQVETGCYYDGPGRSRLVAWDTGETGSDAPIVDLSFEGEIVSSRLIEDRLFVLTSYRPDFVSLTEKALPPDLIKDEYTEEEFFEIIRSIDADQLLPRVTGTDGVSHPLVSAENILVPPLPGTRLAPVLNVLSVFEVADLAAPPQSMAILGWVNGLYASQRSVWLASAKENRVLTGSGRVERTGFIDTDLHRFAIEDEGVVYTGSGTIEGSIGYDPAALAYRLSEYDGALRVLSHSDSWFDRWDEWGSNRLTVLATTAGDDLLLKTRAVLPNADRPERIGKPGEDVFGVRFFGERGYVVTFERIDPLYAIDLADPDDPVVLGGLEIRGFSDYLHPVSEDLLLGVGLDSVVIDAGTPMERSVDQGVQVGLFDVSNATAPVLLDRDVIGFRGTWTSVLDSFHAFTWLPGDEESNRPTRFAIPVAVRGPDAGMPPDPDPTAWYDWQLTGVMQYEIPLGTGPLGLRRLGIANVATRETTEPEETWRYDHFTPDAMRSVIHTDRLMVTWHGGLFSLPWGATAALSPADDCALCVRPGVDAP
jgi:hypothetical protein